jgi:SAM-dependent methyltransferase
VLSLIRRLETAVGEAEAVLDVGCGGNSPLGRFARRPARSVGVDLYLPWLQESRRKGIHDDCVALDVLQIERRFGPSAFDVLLCCDLLEHLDKADGEELLRQMEQVASRRVVVLTPNGFLPQEATWGNPYQVHRAGWTATELRARGYQVAGLNGLALLRGERGLIRWRPAKLWRAVSCATRPLAYVAPSLAFHLLCVKDVAGDARSDGLRAAA